MRRMRALLVVLIAGCHAAPTLTVARQQVKQGETTVVLIDKALAISVAAAPDGLTAESDGKMLAIHAGYQLSGAQQLRLRLDDHAGGIGETTVEVDVLPIGWQWS